MFCKFIYNVLILRYRIGVKQNFGKNYIIYEYSQWAATDATYMVD